jgi:hypothetical protein
MINGKWEKRDVIGVLGKPSGESRILGINRIEHRFWWTPLLWDNKCIWIFSVTIITDLNNKYLEGYYKTGWNDWVIIKTDPEPSIGLRKTLENIVLDELDQKWSNLVSEPVESLSEISDKFGGYETFRIISGSSDIHLVNKEIFINLKIGLEKNKEELIKLVYSFDKALVLKIFYKKWYTEPLLGDPIENTQTILEKIIN